MLRLLIAILVALQLAGPTAWVMAEPAPRASSHSEHLGTEGDPGCHPFHDEALCGSCRFFDAPQALAGSTTIPALPSVPAAAQPGLTDVLPNAPADPRARARAPPCI